MSGKSAFIEPATQVWPKVTRQSAATDFSNITLATIDVARLTPAEDEFWFEVYASTRAEEMAMTGWDATQKSSFLHMQYEAQKQSYQSQFPQAENYVVRCEGIAAGRMIVDRSTEEIQLIDIALLPDFRGRTIGSFLFAKLFDEATADRKPVRLFVERFNPALQWYERLGFRPVGESAIYFEMVWRPDAGKEAS